MKIRNFVDAHKLLVGIGAFVLVAVAVFGILWFEPQKLFLEDTVKEAAPNPAVTTPAGGSPTPSVVTVASGTFKSLEHRTTGQARLLRLADGSHVLRFENLDTSNGPDLRVYLSELPSNLGWRDYGEQYIELAPLKGNRGDQNYKVPTGTDIAKFRSAVIWCVRFKVGFGVAPLNAT
jgi:electron transfer DM13